MEHINEDLINIQFTLNFVRHQPLGHSVGVQLNIYLLSGTENVKE